MCGHQTSNIRAGSNDTLFKDAEEANTLQGVLSKIVDAEVMARLSSRYENQRECNHVRRLRDLQDPSTSHEWVGCINAVHGPVLPPNLLLTALKVRVGIPLVESCGICPCCGITDMDDFGLPSLCCAKSASTKGHYSVRDRVLELTHLADPTAVTEVTNLIPSAPTLRPVDILTTAALPGRLAALDIGIGRPDVCKAGIDCCDSMYESKCSKYSNPMAEATDLEFEYRPLVFSCYGRVHPEGQAILKILAQVAARRRGGFNYEVLVGRVHRNIGVKIWRRLALMVHQCMTKFTVGECQLLNSEPGGESD